MRDYEVVYILDSTLERESVDEKIESFHAVLGGEITSVDHWGVRRLAYPIRKSQTGYYVIAHVTADPAALPEFERLLRLDEETMRYLVVVNEGQPTSGESVSAERPRPPAPEDGGGGEDGVGGEDVAEAGDREDDNKEGPGGDGDESPDDGAEGEQAEAGPPPSSGPPEFSGARGRRRRHEGPPIALLNYKDVTTLSRFLTEQGRILPKRTTKVTARFQRQLGTAVKRARFLALLPYVRDHGS